MPTFRRELPPEGKHRGFDLIRTPQSSTLQAIVTCENFIVCDTHYWHGRTIPCERICDDRGNTIDDTPCQACREKIGYRSHCYVSAFDAKRCEHFLFECTAHAAKPLAEYHSATYTLRGCVIFAKRPRGTPNGKVCIETGTCNQQKVHLPEPPDLMRALCVIWRVPLTALSHQLEMVEGINDAEGYTTQAPTIHTNAKRMNAMRKQPDNAGTEADLAERKRAFDADLAKAVGGNGKPKREKVRA